ncbi:hypothetical protein HPB47_023324 [Ixodes persulcatus]|uniref:Uncharacterized protein n=1 Tax=Ixodes persulcatus TaxID=34615 RepID=A0AC60Q797_IXOPE|nr:hypothetical protein HPB47_023324 [Ixodes persulcatus]
MASAEADPMDAIEPVVLTEETTEKDHAYHIISPSQRPHAPVKRRFDTTDDSTSQEFTPAKLLLSNCDSMDASQKEGDDEGFILVEHRRKRTTGILVLFTPTQEGRRLQQLNPLKLNDEVRAAAGAPFVRHRFTARGGLLVDVAKPATVNRLLKVRCLEEILVLATIPKAYMQNNGLIKGVPDCSRVPVLECIVNVRALDGASVCVDLDCSEDSSNEPVPLSLGWISSSKKLFSTS